MSVNEVKLAPAPTPLEIRGTGPLTSRTFVIGDEDHTLGNALRHVLMNDARVDFAGYCVPHPSEPVVHVRVQTATTTADESNGTEALTATEAIKEACTTLEHQCDFVLEELEKALPEVREDREWIERLEAEELMHEADDDDEE